MWQSGVMCILNEPALGCPKVNTEALLLLLLLLLLLWLTCLLAYSALSLVQMPMPSSMPSFAVNAGSASSLSRKPVRAHHGVAGGGGGGGIAVQWRCSRCWFVV
jgi:hypothetical protein